jgi:hypothetical protein
LSIITFYILKIKFIRKIHKICFFTLSIIQDLVFLTLALLSNIHSLRAHGSHQHVTVLACRVTIFDGSMPSVFGFLNSTRWRVVAPVKQSPPTNNTERRKQSSLYPGSANTDQSSIVCKVVVLRYAVVKQLTVSLFA